MDFLELSCSFSLYTIDTLEGFTSKIWFAIFIVIAWKSFDLIYTNIEGI